MLTGPTHRLLWAAVVGGRHPTFEPDMYSKRKEQFNLWRIYSALGFLNYEDDGFLCVDSTLRELDPTEKGQIGYAIGALCANVIAWDLLGARAVVHVSAMDRYHPGWLRIDPAAGKKRPDYVAVDAHGDCFVIEAKGRAGLQNATRTELRTKRQTGAITGVYPLLNGLPNPLRTRCFVPKARVGVAADYGSKQLKVFATDPPPEMVVRVAPEDIISVYYRELFDNSDAERAEDEWQQVGGISYKIEIPAELQQYTELSPDDELSLLPTWRSVTVRSSEEVYDRFALLQQFQTAFTRAYLDGEVREDLWDRPLAEGSILAPNGREAQMTEVARELWGENGEAILRQIVVSPELQPDGTTVEIINP